jgi:hypothetical protein
MIFMSTQIQLTMNEDQAKATAFALDLCSRLLSGQLEEVAALVRQGHIPMFAQQQAPETVCAAVHDLARQIKSTLGYPANSHHGLGHPLTPPMGDRAYEVMKVLKKALADHNDPHPVCSSIDHDGLVVRYTRDPSPSAVVFHDGPRFTSSSPLF